MTSTITIYDGAGMVIFKQSIDPDLAYDVASDDGTLRVVLIPSRRGATSSGPVDGQPD